MFQVQEQALDKEYGTSKENDNAKMLLEMKDSLFSKGKKIRF
jgi:hypothetical protein